MEGCMKRPCKKQAIPTMRGNTSFETRWQTAAVCHNDRSALVVRRTASKASLAAAATDAAWSLASPGVEALVIILISTYK